MGRISPYFSASSFESHLNLPAKRNLDVRCQMPQCRCQCSAGHSYKFWKQHEACDIRVIRVASSLTKVTQDRIWCCFDETS